MLTACPPAFQIDLFSKVIVRLQQSACKWNKLLPYFQLYLENDVDIFFRRQSHSTTHTFWQTVFCTKRPYKSLKFKPIKYDFNARDLRKFQHNRLKRCHQMFSPSSYQWSTSSSMLIVNRISFRDLPSAIYFGWTTNIIDSLLCLILIALFHSLSSPTMLKYLLNFPFYIDRILYII